MGTSANESEREMTPAARIVYGLALVIGLSVGAFFGFWKDAGHLKSYYSARRVTAPRELGDFSFVQYRHADAGHARIALLAFASFLEKLEALNPDMGERLNLAGTYTRLALLEDAANNAQASDDYMAKAQSWYTAGGGQTHSDSEMKAAFIDGDKRLEQLGIR
jgi:hypothetical protein